MLKKIAVPVVLFLFLIIVPPFFYLFDYSQSISITDKKVVYELPYPGLLPDHPLYFFKVSRDRILEFATRDYLKKAELYLLFSDKRVRMAESLTKKGKHELAATTFAKAEKYFLKIIDLLRQSKSQGVGASQEFVERLSQSNAKHKEVLQQLLKEFPQGQEGLLNEALRINEDVRRSLSLL